MEYAGAVAIMGMVWKDGAPVDTPVGEDTLKDLVEDPSALVWIDLCGVSFEQLHGIGEALKLDAHSLEDTLSVRERPKATRFDGYTFTTIYGAKLGRHTHTGRRVKLARISAYALPTCLLTIRRDTHFDMDPVVDRWKNDPKLAGFGVDGLLQGLLDVAIDQQFDVLQGLDDDAESLIDQVFVDRPNLKELQKQTFAVRRELVDLRRVVPPMRDVVSMLVRAGSIDRRWTAELLTYYEDLNDHTLRATEWLDNLRDLVSSIFETNLALNDNQMNDAMKRLAGWAAIIAVPTLVTGWFGQNIPYPGFSNVFGLIQAAVLVIGGVVALFIVFRRKGWI